MAKDPTTSKIPRLDGVSRIPLPGTLRTQQKSQISCLITNNRAIQSTGTRTVVPQISKMSKKLIGIKNSETNLTDNRTIQKISNNPENPNKTEIISENKSIDNEINNVTITQTKGQCEDKTLEIIPSETFIRENSENELPELNQFDRTHVIKETNSDINDKEISSKNLLYRNQSIEDNLNIQNDQLNTTIKNEDIVDLTFVCNDESNNELKEKFCQVPDKNKMKLILSSTMNYEKLIDASDIHSPYNKQMNFTIDTHTLPLENQPNVTKLLCLSRENLINQENDQFINKCDNTLKCDAMEIDENEKINDETILYDNQIILPQDIPNKARFSFGFDLTECTLDCSIELCDTSLSSSAPVQQISPSLKKQNSFEMDESLGILTPDQMKSFLDSTNTNNTNLELPINYENGKLKLHQMRIDQTPSPEDLPLDPVSIKTDINHIMVHDLADQELSQTDSYSKTDQMTKSSGSKVSNSFIASVTSITSLDTGYQGDGEMSRPVSRNGNKKSNLIKEKTIFNQQNIPIRRQQDPMTDSDFFTESDADDIFNRGDRLAQVIDGQMWTNGQMLQQPSNIFITEQQQNIEDSCMESSGIFTDIENRCDDDITQNRRENDIYMSPDGSTDTIKSNNNDDRQQQSSISSVILNQPNQNNNILTDSQSSIQSSLSNEHINSINSGINLQKKTNEIITETQMNSANNEIINEKALSFEVHNTPKKNSKVKEFSTNNDDNNINSPQNHKRGHHQTTTSATLSVKKLTSTCKHYISVINSNDTSNIIDTGNNKKNNINNYVKKIKNNDFNNTMVKNLSKNKIINDDDKRNNLNNSINSINSVTNNSGQFIRKHVPNKWDAVMNKIAENKLNKKNYNEVKPKVMCGVLKRSTTGITKSPSAQSQDSNCGSNNNVSDFLVSQIKRTPPNAAKRGRSFSKDSQQSSQSDLSISGGSTQPQNKSPNTRSAKKRDVRTLSISPTDLGPPPKTQTNGVQPSKQQSIALQKRIAENNHSTIQSQLGSNKSSPQTKKIVPRRPQSQQSQTKSTIKDPNRLVNHNQQQKQKSESPKSNGHALVKTNSTSSVIASTPISKCVTVKSTFRKTLSRASQSPILNLKNNNNNNSINSIITLETNYKQQILHASKGAEALGLLVQYLVFDLDAFASPGLKKEVSQTKESLRETIVALEDIKTTCNGLQEQLQEKEIYYTTRESELQSLHRCELKKAESSLTELEQNARDRIEAIQNEFKEKEATNEKKFRDYIEATEMKLSKQQEEINAAKDKEIELLKRISVLSTTENDLREKIFATETNFSERLNIAAQRERELIDKVNSLNQQIDILREKTEYREKELKEKLNLSHDEISILRNSRNSLDNSASGKNLINNSLNGSNIGFNNSPITTGPCKIQMLQDEVESLRCVLELKQSEISELRKHKEELQRSSNELQAAQFKISALESRVEDLQIQLKSKIDEEKELLQRNKHLQDSYTHELKNRNRLSLHNEELQWRLKQNSEKFALALTEVSKSYQDQFGFSNESKSSFQSHDNTEISSQNSSLGSLNRTNGSDRMVGCFQMDDISPPTSPIIKGVVEKNDSVSWVLEIDDESPEVLASRMIKRASSLRSSFNDKSPNGKRQLSLGVTDLNSSNPLSQSASATSVIKEHSNIQIGNNDYSSSWKEPNKTSSPYISKRHNLRTSPKPMARSLNGSTTSHKITFSRSRSNTYSCPDNDNLKNKLNGSTYRKQQILLMHSSGVRTSERCDLRTLNTHNTVQDFKGLKKCQEIQESAGEAMVSGMNSEDENCSASSDDNVSSTSTSSLENGGKQQMSMKDRLLLDKINSSLGGTPMEISWDDIDHYPSESVV